MWRCELLRICINWVVENSHFVWRCNESCCCTLFFSRSCFFVTSKGGVVSRSSRALFDKGGTSGFVWVGCFGKMKPSYEEPYLSTDSWTSQRINEVIYQNLIVCCAIFGTTPTTQYVSCVASTIVMYAVDMSAWRKRPEQFHFSLRTHFSSQFFNVIPWFNYVFVTF